MSQESVGGKGKEIAGKPKKKSISLLFSCTFLYSFSQFLVFIHPHPWSSVSGHINNFTLHEHSYTPRAHTHTHTPTPKVKPLRFFIPLAQLPRAAEGLPLLRYPSRQVSQSVLSIAYYLQIQGSVKTMQLGSRYEYITGQIKSNDLPSNLGCTLLPSK